jgi:hypothetical protein
VNKFFDIAMGFIAVAGITTVVSHPNTAKVITAGGGAFDNSLKAAEGN